VLEKFIAALLLPLPTKRGVQLIGYVILPVADVIFPQFHAEVRVGFATEEILRLQVDACDKEMLHRLPGNGSSGLPRVTSCEERSRKREENS